MALKNKIKAYGSAINLSVSLIIRFGKAAMLRAGPRLGLWFKSFEEGIRMLGKTSQMGSFRDPKYHYYIAANMEGPNGCFVLSRSFCCKEGKSIVPVSGAISTGMAKFQMLT
jgi:hypothetical protein